MKIIDSLYKLLAPVVESMGYILWGIEFLPAGRHSTLRIYIDREEGISVEDCEKVSHQASAILDVEDMIKGEYNLEVSSPGMDRPLFFPSQYQYYCDEELQLQLLAPVNGAKKWRGKLLSVDEKGIEIEVEGQSIPIAFANVVKARVVPDFS